MWTAIWIFGMVGGIIMIDKAFRPKPIKTTVKKRARYSPRLIEPDGTIVCMKDIDIKG